MGFHIEYKMYSTGATGSTRNAAYQPGRMIPAQLFFVSPIDLKLIEGEGDSHLIE
jgi:hypothetical protein